MISNLNPEAPEFHPNVTQITQEGYGTLNKTIRSSNNLPTGVSFRLFKTYPDFNVVSRQLGENVINQSNYILSSEKPILKLKREDSETNIDKITDTNDNILDRVIISIDTETGLNKPDQFSNGAPGRPNVASWNAGPIITKVQVGSTTLISAKNITRPQINFKDKIDNSLNLWVPKISDKPNSIKPLALKILYNEDGEAIGYEHPYKLELRYYEPPAKFLEPDTNEITFPMPLDQTNLVYVDTEAKLDALVEHLNNVQEIAVDVEHHSYRTYQGITCLLQISTDEGGDFIIDTLAIREHIHKLNQAFTDPKKLKVLHGAEYDVTWLQRDFGVYIVGLFDTHLAAKILGLPTLSLKYLLLKYCKVDADKKYQLADWRIRPLPDELIEYARMDTHYLLYIWRKLKAELLEKGAGQPHVLCSVFEQSRQICGITYNKPVINENSHMPLYLRSKKTFNSQQMAALRMLYKWRDTVARENDESTNYLLPNHMLLALADTLPREVQGVNACCSPMPPYVKQNLNDIHRMILSCRELPNEPQLFRMPTSIRKMTAPISLTYNVHDLSHYADNRVDNFINLDRAYEIIGQFTYFQPDILALQTEDFQDNSEVVYTDNISAKQFNPPYIRYQKYRSLAQVEEIKIFKQKEAKIAAIGKGNELVKKEVLEKLQRAEAQIIKEQEQYSAKTDVKVQPEEKDVQRNTQRKRKISPDKIEHKDSESSSSVNKKTESTIKHPENNERQVKPYKYTNANYKKFYHETNNKRDKNKKYKKYSSNK